MSSQLNLPCGTKKNQKNKEKNSKQKQVVKVIWQQVASPPHSGIRQMAPVCTPT